MGNANNQVFITSMSKLVDKARSTGSFDVTATRLYKIYTDYIVYARELELAGDKQSAQHVRFLQDKLVELRSMFGNEICNYKTVIDICGHVPNISPSGSIYSDTPNTSPTVSGATISLTTEESYMFSGADFLTNYFDIEGDAPYKVIIYFSSTPGVFKFNNEVINGIFEFDIAEAHKLTYTRANDDAFTTSFSFRVSDNAQNSKYSDLATSNITGSLIGNQPATIGDNSIDVASNVTTTLTLAMFTSDLAPPYNDPEQDLIDAIRIDAIHSTNTGKFYLSGIEIQKGDIITRENINAGLFTHTGVDSTTIQTDSFAFSARDEGSGIWVN